MTRVLLAILIMLLLVGLLATSAIAKPACGWSHRGTTPHTCRHPLPTPVTVLAMTRYANAGRGGMCAALICPTPEKP